MRGDDIPSIPVLSEDRRISLEFRWEWYDFQRQFYLRERIAVDQCPFCGWKGYEHADDCIEAFMPEAMTILGEEPGVLPSGSSAYTRKREP